MNRQDAQDLVNKINSYASKEDCAAGEGVTLRTVYRWQQQAQRVLADQAFRTPELPSPELGFEELLRTQYIPDNRLRLERKAAENWFTVDVKTPGRYALVVLGDQHIDDPFCDLGLFYEHVQLLKNRPNVLTLPIGDLHNNWVGRLNRLHSESNMSEDRAYDGIRWLLLESGLNIPVAIMGNHDEWNNGSRLVKEILRNSTTVVADWRARFKLRSPCGRLLTVDAAHDHKGHSQFNPLHAQKKAALSGPKANVFIAGHRHMPGYAKDFYPEEGTHSWYVRAGTYKFHDAHAERLGFPQYKTAPAIAIVVDPALPGPNPILTVTDDLEFALSLLG